VLNPANPELHRGRKDEKIRPYANKKASSENPPPLIGPGFLGEAFLFL